MKKTFFYIEWLITLEEQGLGGYTLFFFFQDDEKLKTNRKGWLYVETTRDVKEIKLNYNLISFQLYSLNCVISYNSTQL